MTNCEILRGGIGVPELSNPAVIKRILTDAGFSFKKSLGQNFLIDDSVCPEMAAAATENGEEFALEIGPGIGVLTAELAKNFDSVTAIELDERLRPVLKKTLAEFDNTEVVWGDCMKLDLKKLIEERAKGRKTAVCANLPYYITSPIIMMLLEARLPITSITVMVQKEAAERLCAEVGSRESGAVTVAVRYFSEPEILFGVDRDSFMPAPNVDSAVIRLKILEKPPIVVADEKKFFRFVKAAFGQRRKTLTNSLSSIGGYSKSAVSEVLTKLNLRADVRAEALDMNSLADIFNALQS